MNLLDIILLTYKYNQHISTFLIYYRMSYYLYSCIKPPLYFFYKKNDQTCKNITLTQEDWIIIEND